MSVEVVKKYFEGTELEGKVLEFEESSATVELAAAAVGTDPDRIAKTLSYILEEGPILIVMSGKSRLDNRKYKDTFHKKAKMIPFDEVEDLVGHPPGGVCPFAVKDGVSIYLDESLKKHETVFPAAGSGNSAIEMTMKQLEEFTKEPKWIDVSKMPENAEE